LNLKKFREKFGKVAVGISYVSMALLFAMVIIVAVDVILRKAQIGRINGSNELTGFFLVIVCTLGIPVLQIKNGHVWVNLFVNKFPYKFRCFWRFAITLVETAAIAMLVIGAYNKVVLFAERSALTDVLNLPKWLFAAFSLLAFAEYFILSLVDTIQLFIDGVKNEPPAPTSEAWSDNDVKGL
jgi:TRAP-type C4-dicarboxylate transport system permease small subunit